MLANSRGPPNRFQPYLFANQLGGRKMKKEPEKVFIRRLLLLQRKYAQIPTETKAHIRRRI